MKFFCAAVAVMMLSAVGANATISKDECSLRCDNNVQSYTPTSCTCDQAEN